MHPPGPENCVPAHNAAAFVLAALLSVGLLVSYLPQHGRILYHKSAEGIDPTYLLLGSTSAASSLLNILALSWSTVRCCQFLTPSSCLETLMGIIQIAIQWTCFNLIFLLYLIYFPQTSKYVDWVPGDVPASKPSRFWSSLKRMFRLANFSGSEETASPVSEDSDFDFANASFAAIARHRSERAQTTTSPAWRLSVTYAILTALHFAICGFVTFLLLLTLPKASQPPLPHTPDPAPGPHDESKDVRVVRLWATFLGILSTVLALFQYLPQIRRTWQRKLVGSLSISMMGLQAPGSFIFVYSLAMRPGVNWTTWGVYLSTGILQGVLLAICVAWTIRQRRLGIDAYGRPLNGSEPASTPERRPLLR
ncbi:MAG: hypothetical protein CYPHOPRED_001637 [Cyphobasidiales sp. Tagirdzhanova-0007]|nr:MAG: hypothetical protein CYPHOPRED_001637 [Cyphobasidiales sp. Tagirdzhanova-0007]